MGRDLGPTHCHLHIPLAKEVSGQTGIQGPGKSAPPTAVGSAAESMTKGRDVESTQAGSAGPGAGTQPLSALSQLYTWAKQGTQRNSKLKSGRGEAVID